MRKIISKTMEPYAVRGTLVRYSYPHNGSIHDQVKASEYLQIGKIYSVHQTRVGSWKTDVYLSEVPNIAFNAVMFNDISDEETIIM